jgi:hypothetical protein
MPKPDAGEPFVEPLDYAREGGNAEEHGKALEGGQEGNGHGLDHPPSKVLDHEEELWHTCDARYAVAFFNGILHPHLLGDPAGLLASKRASASGLIHRSRASVSHEEQLAFGFAISQPAFIFWTEGRLVVDALRIEEPENLWPE